MKKSLKVLLASIASMLFVVSAYAQVTTANLSGKVSDAQGAVPGAAVIATHTPSGTTYYSVADAKGQYRLNGIMPGGPYTVKFEMLGYRVLTINGIIAPLAETLVVDAVLEDESISLEGVVVSADSKESGMNISRSGAGTSISQKRMENLPSVGRSMNDVMRMTPQAASTTNGLSIGGGSYRGSAVTVDGAAFNNAFGIGQNLPAGGSPISIDALEQISVNITPFDVRQSGFQGGAINAVTKGGTNELKASVYNYYTSEKLKGDKIGDAEVTNNHALNNTTGFTVGGPIIKNKLFFFVNAEYSMDDVPGSSYVARKTASDSWAGNGGEKNVNRPTVEKLDAMKDYLGSKFNYNPGRYQGYSLSTPDWKVLARIDWNINRDHKLTARYSATHVSGSNQPSSSMSPIGGTNSSFGGGSAVFNRYDQGTQSQYAMYFESSRYFQEQNFYSAAIELNSRLFDGKGSNVLRATWSHQYEPRSYVGDAFPSVYILDNDNAGAAFSGSNNTAIYTTFGCDPFTYGNLRDVTTYTVVDEMSYTLGMHNLIAGASLETNAAVNGFMQGGAGWYVYDSWDAFKADVENPSNTTGPVAFMITHANLADPTAQAFPTFRNTQASLYAQDEMNISDYFKLTAGLRFEMPILSFANENINKDFAAVANDPANANSSFAGLSTADVPASTISVSPRIGFNWDVLKDRSLIVRGGTGIYTGRIPNVWLVSAIGNANVLQYQYINKDVKASNLAGTTDIHFHQNRADVINQLYKGTAFQVADLAAPTGATIISKDLKLPSSWKTSVAVDAKLPFGIKATLEGIYSTNFNEVYASSLGVKESGTIQLPGEPSTRPSWSSEGIVSPMGSKMGGYYLHNTDLRGNYYSVTAQLSKEFDFGLDLMAAYTYSGGQSITDGNGDQVYEMVNTYTIGAANNAVLGNSYYIAPNRLIANASYTIAEGKNFATKIGVMYEGYNVGYIANYSYNRVSYLMNSVSGAGNSQLIYIPTDAEIDQMSFGKLADVKDADNKTIKDAKGNAYTTWIADDGTMAQAYKDFLGSDKYTKKHRGEYSVRNGVVAPWINRFDVRVAQDFYFNVAGKKNTLELALDIKNAGNLINSEWGTYKQLSSATILTYQANNPQAGEATKNYTFTAPEWKTFNNLASTWQMLFSAKLFF